MRFVDLWLTPDQQGRRLYEPERFQFYKMVDIEFARELRKVGVGHPFQKGSVVSAATP